MDNIQTRLSGPKRCPELWQAFLVISEGIKWDNKTGLSRYPSVLPPLGLLSLKSSHCASHDEFWYPRCVRKTATFPSGIPRVPSSALLFDLEVPFLPYHSFFPHSLYPFVSNCACPSLFLYLFRSLPLSLRSRGISPLFFSLFYRLGITASPRGEDVPRGRGVRLNIDYARFETRVMREADRVSPACAATWQGKNS